MKGIILFADFFEDVEGLSTLALLRRAKIDVKSVSLMGRYQITTQYANKIKTDLLLEEVVLQDYDFIVIPGGKAVKTTLSTHTGVKNAILHFANLNKLVATICAAPSLLGPLSLLKDRNFTCFPGVEHMILNGIYRPQLKAVTDGHFITARSAGSIYEFVYEIVQYLKGKEEAVQLLQNIVF
jgi:4-methyl-5(b-hydroxyethyl)-thiazole monophosphate biosynthesis